MEAESPVLESHPTGIMVSTVNLTSLSASSLLPWNHRLSSLLGLLVCSLTQSLGTSTKELTLEAAINTRHVRDHMRLGSFWFI